MDVPTTCDLKRDCPRFPPDRVERLVAKYGERRVPRYTSYPTAAQFQPGLADAQHRDWLAGLDPARPVSLYVHVPFCDRLCWYCGCHTTVVHQRGPIADYVETLLAEIELLAAALPCRLPVGGLHFGGGTPNALAPQDLGAIVGALRSRFDIRPDAEIAAELDPRVLTPAFIQTAARLGFNRASLGVQELDPQVQAAINRLQPLSVVSWAVEALRSAGIGAINLDVMYGLPHQSAEGLARTLDAVLALAPDRLALFGYAHVPWMKPQQKLMPETALPDARERHRQQVAAAERLERSAYVRIGLDHYARKGDSLAAAAASGSMRRTFQGYTADEACTILGLGASSISTLPRGFVQNAARVPDWRERVSRGQLPATRGIALSAEDRVRAALIERLLCDLRVDVADIAAAHGAAASDFAPELFRLREFEADGLVKREGTRITITRLGRPFARVVAAVFDTRSDMSDTARHARAI